jgi:D-alanyl-D-alanine carboxypeptidase (penicillin-binding protein 5/6)
MNKFVFFLFACACFGLEVKVASPSAILINGQTGKVLYEKNARVPVYPASTTKIATLLYILDEKKPDFYTKALVSAEALRFKPSNWNESMPSYWDEPSGTKMGLVRGEKVSVEALVHGLIMVSGNDAANVLAETFAPSIETFMQELNVYLKKIGCVNTTFFNPHGMHDSRHVSSAYDLAIIAKKALENPKFREIVSQTVYKRSQTNKQPPSELHVRNGLLKSGHKHYDARAIGIKTGFHSNAGYNLVAAAEEDGRVLIAVLLGSTKNGDRYQDARKLFDAAFSEKMVRSVLFQSSQQFTHEVEGAQAPLVASLQKDLAITYFPSEQPQCKAHIHWAPLDLPIRKGQKVGEVRITEEDGFFLGKEDLIARTDVELTWTAAFKKRWNAFWTALRT